MVFVDLFGEIEEVISLEQLLFELVVVTYLLFAGLVTVGHFLLFPLFLLKHLDNIFSIDVANMGMRWGVFFTGTDNIVRHPFPLLGNHQFLFQNIFDFLFIKPFKTHFRSYIFCFYHCFVLLFRYEGMCHSNCLLKSRLMVL